MTSGIYKLKFRDGSFYIGKSNNLSRRAEQHWRSLEKGTHAKALQAAYDRAGEPEFYVLMECHEDHIDILEGLFIFNNIEDPKCINTARPCPPSQWLVDNFDIITTKFWSLPTYGHFILWIDEMNAHKADMENLQNTLDKLSEENRKIKKGTIVEELESKLEELKQAIENCNNTLSMRNEEITRLKNRGIFARLFNF